VSDIDVAVVGAGPAGSAAALAAVALDPSARIVLFDRADFPRDKVCGDGIGPEGADALEALGAVSVLADAAPIHRIRITSPDRTSVLHTTARPGYVVPRATFDARLAALAVDRGAELSTVRIRTVEPDGDGVLLNGRHRARVVIGADGANSTVRRQIIGPTEHRDRVAIAMRGYADAPDVPQALTFDFVDDRWPAYAWCFPIGRDRANVGYGVFDSTTLDARRDLTGPIARLFPDVVADPSTLRAHHLPLSTERPEPAYGRVLLAGDAASLVNPLTGEGIYTALVSGALAGTAAVRAREAPGRAYTRALRRRLRRHLRHVGFAAWAFRHQRSVDVSVRAGRRDPRVLEDIVALGLGTGGVSLRMAAKLGAELLRVPRSVH
jgi:geranylgeranyl reductase family protein